MNAYQQHQQGMGMAFQGSRGGKSKSTLAEETLEEEKRKKQEKQIKAQKKERGGPSDVSGGSMNKGGGGSGLIGGAFKLIGGAIDMNAAKKAARRAENRPEHRRMARALDVYKEKKRSKQMGLATLSQAVFDWAASLR